MVGPRCGELKSLRWELPRGTAVWQVQCGDFLAIHGFLPAEETPLDVLEDHGYESSLDQELLGQMVFPGSTVYDQQSLPTIRRTPSCGRCPRPLAVLTPRL